MNLKEFLIQIGYMLIGVGIVFISIWIYYEILGYKIDKRYKKYSKAMDEEMKKNTRAFNKACKEGDYQKCEELTRQFQNWCILNSPK